MVALDITPVPYYAEPTEETPWVSGTHDDRWSYVYKFATLTIVGWNIPLVLGHRLVKE